MKDKRLATKALLLAAVVFICGVFFSVEQVHTAENTVYLGDNKQLLSDTNVDGEKIGWNTSHCNHPITVGSEKFDKGIGFHNRSDSDTYVEFDISSLGMKYFSAYVGILQEADYFLEWGSIIFQVYGDGKLLAESPVAYWNKDPYFLKCSVDGVKKLKLVQLFVDGHSCDAGVWGNACLSVLDPMAAQDTVYLGDSKQLLSDTNVSDAKIGWNTSHCNHPITIGSEKFDKGIGFHNRSDSDTYVEFDISLLGMKYFSAYVGILQEADYFLEWGSITFQVYGDGKLLAESPVAYWNRDPYFLKCSVEGVKKLKLVQLFVDGNSCDAGVWGNACLSVAEPQIAFNPDKTQQSQPEELVKGDVAYLSDLYWQSYKNVQGKRVNRDGNVNNEIILSYNGKIFDKGLGFGAVSAAYDSYIDVNIQSMGFTKLASYYGISRTVSNNDLSKASVKFAVFGDGKKLWESQAVKYGDEMKSMECDITGVKVLRIAVAGASSSSNNWGTWGGAVLSKSGSIPKLYTENTTKPTARPTTKPTVKPTATPTLAPTATPTLAPTATPTLAPTATPTLAPTATPTLAPTATLDATTEMPAVEITAEQTRSATATVSPTEVITTAVSTPTSDVTENVTETITENATDSVTKSPQDQPFNSIGTVVMCCVAALAVVVGVLLVITYKKEKTAYDKNKEDKDNA